MGCGLHIFSAYKSIVNADGSKMTVHDALQIIVQEIDEFFMDTQTDINNPKGFREV